PSTQRNIETLKRDGVIIVEPEAGELASGLVGKGRMEEPEGIVKAAEAYFAKTASLTGKRVMVTAGPTFENIDPVRFIGNYSSGKMGFAIAEEFASRGAEVLLIAGPVSIEVKGEGIKRINVVSAREMYEAAVSNFDGMDYVVLAAAVADYAPETVSESKIKREGTDEMVLKLVKNPDIAATLGSMKTTQKIIGFALETDHELENALHKLKKKNLDWIVLNSLRDPEAGFMKDTNKITIVSDTGMELEFPAKRKTEVAKDIADVVSRK
ncbi:MAG: bifunctional phosphopantothenoylcysteine decarboxylase/phosphopantothenate--cysteine ligase CoaBC, partial [Muribaculaceae bacterium]|nr:bifunctional phosphopantothenoylcysteine decarboxylase/phosphopantothenate--cysteine ligase CoaBC [Muribaculaceae bacterium]